jgi:hypothetical protein
MPNDVSCNFNSHSVADLQPKAIAASMANMTAPKNGFIHRPDRSAGWSVSRSWQMLRSALPGAGQSHGMSGIRYRALATR